MKRNKNVLTNILTASSVEAKNLNHWDQCCSIASYTAACGADIPRGRQLNTTCFISDPNAIGKAVENGPRAWAPTPTGGPEEASGSCL